MKTFRQYILDIFIYIEEATAEETYYDYYYKIPKEDFFKLLELDPTATRDKLGVYSKWLINQYLKYSREGTEENKLRLLNGDIKKYHDTLNKFSRMKALKALDIKDINKFSDIANLINYLANKEEKESKKEFVKSLKGQESVTIYEDNQWTIIVPLTEKTARLYGSGTKWCISSKSRPAQKEYFDQYISKGPLFVIISKTRTDNQGRPLKYLFHFGFGGGEFKDFKNQELDVPNIWSWIKKNLGPGPLNALKKYKDIKSLRDFKK